MDYKKMQEFMELHQSELFKNDMQKLAYDAATSPLIPINDLTLFFIKDLKLDPFSYNLVDILPQLFMGIDIEEVIIPEGVKTIGNLAFANCTKLKTVVIPSTLEELAGDAFVGCTNPALKISIPTAVLNKGIIELAIIEDEDGNEIPDPDDELNKFWKTHVKRI